MNALDYLMQLSGETIAKVGLFGSVGVFCMTWMWRMMTAQNQLNKAQAERITELENLLDKEREDKNQRIKDLENRLFNHENK
ncbi:hypothetical protein SAMN05421823_102522 [Catalinimonas alkaloidigena]|uniref:BhlA holin family protein n=1 Tax=Catalinimonas alkaloidigena TaxID=1075417 RepID=A0A1G9B5S0_9BACT|nr:hypothetical protein [Catalinimonas alkaloidigena]SDK34881.1 hypothetical protein SAMN05421823_102522 [Catalinimonas alkaloidigena]